MKWLGLSVAVADLLAPLVSFASDQLLGEVVGVRVGWRRCG
jgi:hypothetical protein